MPAWQKRQPSVQPRAISIDMRSKIASGPPAGLSSGKGYLLMSTIERSTRIGKGGASARVTTWRPVSGSTAVS
jgi:hypothetical protein